jgi:hypothetical protein
VDEHISPSSDLDGRFAWARIAGDDNPSPRTCRTNKRAWRYAAPVFESDRLAFVNPSPHRPFRDAQLTRSLWIEAPTPFVFDKGVTEGCRTSVYSCCRDDGVIAPLDGGAGIQFVYFKLKRRSLGT